MRGSARMQEAFDNTEKLTQFLMGLNENVTATRGQILMLNPLPFVSQALQLLIQDELQRKCAIVDGNNGSIIDLSTALLSKELSATFQPRANKGNNFDQTGKAKGKWNCTYYGGNTHSKGKCFLLHGFPKWHKMFWHQD